MSKRDVFELVPVQACQGERSEPLSIYTTEELLEHAWLQLESLERHLLEEAPRVYDIWGESRIEKIGHVLLELKRRLDDGRLVSPKSESRFRFCFKRRKNGVASM